MKFKSKGALLALTFSFGLLLTNPASAQPDARLCGIGNVALGVGLLFEWKKAKGKKQRKGVNKLCTKVKDEITAGLKAAGLPATGWKYYQRSECEGTAGELSKGKSKFDICDLMDRSEGKTIRIYKVQYDKKTQQFSADRFTP